MRNRILRIAGWSALVLLLGAVGVGVWGYRQFAASLPQLDGSIRVRGLDADVSVQRDRFGIPTIRAENRRDLARATGFVHGQDRFFQMDLLRRNSAGELAEIVGPAAVPLDRKVRVHRFRDVARRVIEQSDDQERALIAAYVEGVNAGFNSLEGPPFEYLLLGVEPAPWTPEDTILVVLSMYLDLQSDQYDRERTLAAMHDALPPELFAFLTPPGTEWDAPIVGEPLEGAPMPSSDVVDLRRKSTSERRLAQAPTVASAADFADFVPGSNNWAVSGERTADGRAIVADDMHLGIRVPHIWYRASFVWPSADVPEVEERITGVTLPGAPAMIVGSNGRIAWGFTNTEGDWSDLVIVEPDPADEEQYLAPDGPQPYVIHEEVIQVAGALPETLQVKTTIWGPIVDEDSSGRPRALRWVAHDPEGVNVSMLKLETARGIEAALDAANNSGSPAQNFVVADADGRIAWTVLGRIPRRIGFDGRLPASWADGSCGWDGYLEPREYPRIVAPEGGRIWTANARVVNGDMLGLLGDGGYDLGARAKQIRDGLAALDQADELDMLAIQLDDRAVLLERWRDLLLATLNDDAVAGDQRRSTARAYIEDWGGRASIDSVGFRLVRAFRHQATSRSCDGLVVACLEKDREFRPRGLRQTEGPVWQLLSERPQHLLAPAYESWDELLLEACDAALDELPQRGANLSACTWGEHNTTRIQHPLSMALPWAGPWLDMPSEPLPGDSQNMPRIQAPAMGASQRMAVSPGREEDGYFHMPGGQSGHPLSPHYRDQHAAWANGKPLPFLPGEPIHTLVLEPAG